MPAPLNRFCLVAFIAVCLSLQARAQTVNEYLNLCDKYYNREVFDTAFIYAEKALQQAEKDSGKGSRLYARMADQCMGMVLEKQGRYAEALHWYETSLSIYRQLGSVSPVFYGEALTNLGNLYVTIGGYNKAEELLLSARDLLKNISILMSEGYDAATNRF
jgi:tetratricopeptide (TPR) repeat protein